MLFWHSPFLAFFDISHIVPSFLSPHTTHHVLVLLVFGIDAVGTSLSPGLFFFDLFSCFSCRRPPLHFKQTPLALKRVQLSLPQPQFNLFSFAHLENKENKEKSVSVLTNSGYRSYSVVECIVIWDLCFLPNLPTSVGHLDPNECCTIPDNSHLVSMPLICGSKCDGHDPAMKMKMYRYNEKWKMQRHRCKKDTCTMKSLNNEELKKSTFEKWLKINQCTNESLKKKKINQWVCLYTVVRIIVRIMGSNLPTPNVPVCVFHKTVQPVEIPLFHPPSLPCTNCWHGHNWRV